MRWVASDDTITLTKETKIISRSCSTMFIRYTRINIHTHITQTRTQVFLKGLYLQLSHNFDGFANNKKLLCYINTIKRGKLYRTPLKTFPGSQKYHDVANAEAKTLMLEPKD